MRTRTLQIYIALLLWLSCASAYAAPSYVLCAKGNSVSVKATCSQSERKLNLNSLRIPPQSCREVPPVCMLDETGGFGNKTRCITTCNASEYVFQHSEFTEDFHTAYLGSRVLAKSNAGFPQAVEDDFVSEPVIASSESICCPLK